MIDWILVACAFIGGLFASFVGYFDDPAGSRKLSPHIYWGRLIIFNPLCGAFLVLMYILDGDAVSHFLAMNVGISAPLFIKEAVRSGTGNRPLSGSDVEPN